MGSIHEIEPGGTEKTYTALRNKQARERQHKHAERSAVRCTGCWSDTAEAGLHIPASSSWGPAASWVLSVLRTIYAVLPAFLSHGYE